jgi:hypothetical protein
MMRRADIVPCSSFHRPLISTTFSPAAAIILPFRRRAMTLRHFYFCAIFDISSAFRPTDIAARRRHADAAADDK